MESPECVLLILGPAGDIRTRKIPGVSRKDDFSATGTNRAIAGIFKRKGWSKNKMQNVLATKCIGSFFRNRIFSKDFLKFHNPKFPIRYPL